MNVPLKALGGRSLSEVDCRTIGPARFAILAPVSAVASRLQLRLADGKSLLGVNSVRSAAMDFQIVSGSAIHLFS